MTKEKADNPCAVSGLPRPTADEGGRAGACCLAAGARRLWACVSLFYDRQNARALDPSRRVCRDGLNHERSPDPENGPQDGHQGRQGGLSPHRRWSAP